MLPRETVLVGREREQQQLSDLLDAACAESGRLVLVSGEAGIGKTTLVRGLEQQARERGALVLRGACYDLTTTPSYGPWTEVIQSYQPSGGQPPVPTWFEQPGGVAQLGNQATLFDETRRFFSAIADQQPLVIVLEDLHWSDPATPDALRYLARTLSDRSVCIVVTYRVDEADRQHPFIESIPALVREANAHRVELRRWNQEDCGALLANRYDLPRNDQARLADYCHGLADGNPFFTVELLHSLEGEGVLWFAANDHWVLEDLTGIHVPPLVRQVIERRLRAVSPETRDLLQLASVIGHATTFELWQAISEVADDRLGMALQEALRAQLVDQLPDRGGFRFRHSLMRESLYLAINGLLLRRLHVKIAELLSGDPAISPHVVAHHFLRAGDERAFYWLVRAGERAQRAYAWNTAQERYEMAIDLVSDIPDRAREYGWLLYRLGVNQRASDPALSQERMNEARRLASQADDPVLNAYTLIIEGLILEFRGAFRDGISAMEQGVKKFDELLEDGPVRPYTYQARLFADLTQVDQFQESPAMTANPGRGALVQWYAATGRCDDVFRVGYRFVEDEAASPEVRDAVGHSLYDAYLGLGVAHVIRGEPEKAIAALNQAIEGYVRWDHRVLASATCQTIVEWVLLPYYSEQLSERRRIVEMAEELVGVNRSVPIANPMGHYDPNVAWSLILEGNWDDAWNLAIDIVEQTGAAVWRCRAVSVLIWLARERGDRETVKRYLGQFAVAPDLLQTGDHPYIETLMLHRQAAQLALDEGDLELARSWLSGHDHWLDWAGAVYGRAEGRLYWSRLHLAAGDLDRAVEDAEWAMKLASDPREPLTQITIGRHLGEIQTQQRRYDDAGQTLVRAGQLAERVQAPYELALIRLAQAELAIATKDIPRARDLLARARDAFKSLNAHLALDRSSQVESALEAMLDRYPAGLTPREVEVLCLTAAGLSNKDIAGELYLSVRTVERHLTNIYRKIGANNRVEAGAFVLRHGLRIPPT